MASSSKCTWAMCHLTTETIEGAALSLQGVHNIHSGDSLALGMLSVGNSVTDDVLQEDLEDTAGLFVDETRDALHTTTASETADSGLGDALEGGGGRQASDIKILLSW